MKYLGIALLMLLMACEASQPSFDPVIEFDATQTPDTILVGEAQTVQIKYIQEIDWDKRRVVFKVSDPGTFENGEPMIMVTASSIDTNTTAQALLKSNTPGTVQLSAYPEKFEETFTISKVIHFVNKKPEDVFNVEIANLDTVPADNFSSYEVNIIIEDDIDLGTNKISFTTDKGEFRNGQKTVEVFPGPGRVGTFFLKHSLAETATVLVSFKGVEESVNLPFRPIDQRDIFSIGNVNLLDTPQVVADNFSLIPIEIELLRPTSEEEPLILEVSEGIISFNGEQGEKLNIQGDVNENILVNFKSDKQGLIYFNVAFLNERFQFPIAASPALPDDISILPASGVFEVSPLTIFEVDAELSRSQGVVSSGVGVEYSTNNANMILVESTNSELDEDQILSKARFTYNDTLSNAVRVLLRARSGTAKDSIFIWVKP